MKKRFLSMLLAIVMVVGLMPASVLANDDTTNILVIGDSISTGYGLADASSQSFAALLAEEGYTVVNKAVDGNTVAGIAAQLQGNVISSNDIAAADVITITVGGNDLMALLYAEMAEMYNAANDPDIAAEDVVTILAELNSATLITNQSLLSLLNYAQSLLTESSPAYLMDSEDFTVALTTYQAALTGIITSLKEANPDVSIIVATQYNPYVEFNDVMMMVPLDPLYEGIEDGVTMLNEAIIEGAATGGYIVADVKAAFDDAKDDLYNASPELSTISLDFHPNAAGHAVIADTFLEILTSYNTVAEASWGASESNLTNSGTLKEAVAAAAAADSNVKYIKMNRDVDITADNYFIIDGGDFTLDMGGYTLSWGNTVLYIYGGKVVFKNGTFTSAWNQAIWVEGDMESTEITFESGTYNNPIGTLVFVRSAKQLTVKQDVTMRSAISIEIGSSCAAALIEGASLDGSDWDISCESAVKITAGIYCIDSLYPSLDLTDHPDPAGTIILDAFGEMFDEPFIDVDDIDLPEGYGLFDQSGTRYTEGICRGRLTVKSLHEHSWIYELDGQDTIKATCIAEGYLCPLNADGGSVSIAAPASTGYTGSAIEATVINSLTTGDTVTVVYTGENLVSGLPVTIGTYTATITLGGQEISAEYTITHAEHDYDENTHRCACGDIEQFTITFIVDGEEYATITQDYDTAITAPADPTKVGYTFDGWDTNIPQAMPAENLIIKALWSANEYRIGYDTQGGTINGEYATSYTYGVGTKLPTNVTRSGYIFRGWYDNEACTGTPVTVITATDIGDKIFYAKWDVDITPFLPLLIKYDIDVVDGIIGGTVTTDKSSASVNDKVNVTVVPAEGYTIQTVIVTDAKGNAVTVNVNGEGKYSFKMPMRDVTVYAVFDKTEVPITPATCPRDYTCPMYPFTDLELGAWYHDGVHFVIENALMGSTNTDLLTFAPELTATRAMIVTILWRLEGEPVLDYLMQFEDVPQDKWYTEAIRWAAANGIVLGYDGLFNPENPITREQLAAILHRYAAYKGTDNGVSFPMIPQQYDYSLWAENDIIWADMNGLLDGIGNDMTDMTAHASRAEVAAMLRQFCERFAAE